MRTLANSLALAAALCVASAGCIYAANNSMENHRIAVYKALINRVTNGRYDELKQRDPEDAIIFFADRAFRAGQVNFADSLYRRILDAQIKSLGPEDLSVAVMSEKYGNFCFCIQKEHEAIRFYIRTLVVQARRLGVFNACSAKTLGELGLHSLCNHGWRDRALNFFWLQAITLHRLYPESTSDQCLTRLLAIDTCSSKGEWIDAFARDWNNPLYKLKPSEELLPSLPSLGFGNQKLLKNSAEEFAKLVKEHYSSFDGSRGKSVFTPHYLNRITGVVESPQLGIRESFKEISKAQNDPLAGGRIEFTPLRNGDKITGCFVRIGDPATSKPLLTKDGDPLVLQEHYEANNLVANLSRTIEELSGTWIERSLPVQVHLLTPIGKEAEVMSYFGSYIPAEMRKDWKPPGFSFWLPTILTFTITLEGTVKNLRLVQSSGSSLVDRFAISSIQKSYRTLPKSCKTDVEVELRFGSAMIAGQNVQFGDYTNFQKRNPTNKIFEQMADCQRELNRLMYKDTPSNQFE